MTKKKVFLGGLILLFIISISTLVFIKLKQPKEEVVKQIEEKQLEEKQEDASKSIKMYELNDDGTIYFEDKNLEKAIKKILKKDVLNPADALNVKTLLLNNKKIKSIKGIEFFKNLKELSLDENYIINIDYIKNMTNLTYLNCAHNFIRNISILSNLKNLQHLNLTANDIIYIKPILNLKKLFYPKLQVNSLLDYDLLAKNTNLYYNNMVKDYVYVYPEDKNNKIIYTDNDEPRELIVDFIKSEKNVFDYDIKTYKEGMNIAKNFVRKNINDKMSDLEKEKRIVKYLVDTMYYESAPETIMPEDDIDDPLMYMENELYTSLVEGKGVCQNYTYAFNILARLSGLESYAVSANDHTWNVVKIGNKFYHLDVTWIDDMYMPEILFNVSTATMNKTHRNNIENGEKYKYVNNREIDISKDDMVVTWDEIDEIEIVE